MSPQFIVFEDGETTTAAFDAEIVEKLFPNLFGQVVIELRSAHHAGTNRNGVAEVDRKSPKTVGVVLSGGPATGGRKVICGLFDYVNHTIQILASLPSCRTKIKTPEQFAVACYTAKKLNHDALPVVGGDDSNRNVTKLAEEFKVNGIPCVVNGAPKTGDNDRRNEQVEQSFGFDTAVKSYAQSVPGLRFDDVSARKLFHFIRVIGRPASHNSLECPPRTHSNLCFIGEEVKQQGMTLVKVVDQIADFVRQHAKKGVIYGCILLPEGSVQFMPDGESLFAELSELLAHCDEQPSWEQVASRLNDDSAKLLQMIPEAFARQSTLERDPHGNVQVAKIEAERLLIGMVSALLLLKKKEGSGKGKISGFHQYLGFDSQCAMRTNFDTSYTHGPGRVAGAFCCAGKSGYIASLSGLTKSAEKWPPAGFPLIMMMNVEHRHETDVTAIRKTLVDLDGRPFKTFAANRGSWRLLDSYRSPGAAQTLRFRRR